MLFFLVTFPFGAIVADSFKSESDMAGFLGLFSAAATGLTFLASLFFVNRLFARIGVVASLLIVPLVYFAGFGTWLISFTLVSATMVRGVQWVAVNALGGTAWSSLFNAVPGRRRSQVMAFISGVPTQLGTMAAGGILILAGTLSPDVISGVGLTLALVLVVLVLRMRPAYIEALTNAIRQGMVDVFDAPLRSAQPATLDADGLAALVTTLDDPQPAARILAIRTLGRLRPGQVSEQLESALVDEDAAVRAAALETIASPQAAESRLIDPSSRVRRSAIAILERGGEKVVPAAATVLQDSDPTVRASAAVLVGIDQGRPVIDEMLTSSDPLTLVAALSALARQPGLSARSPEQFGRDPDRRVRAAAARAMASRLDCVSTLRELLEDSSIRVRSAAAASLASSSVETLIEVLATGSVRASEAALVAMTDAGLGEEQLAGWVAGEVDRARFLRRHHLALSAGGIESRPRLPAASTFDAPISPGALGASRLSQFGTW